MRSFIAAVLLGTLGTAITLKYFNNEIKLRDETIASLITAQETTTATIKDLESQLQKDEALTGGGFGELRRELESTRTGLPPASMPADVMAASYRLEVDNGNPLEHGRCSVTAFAPRLCLGAGHCATDATTWAVALIDDDGNVVKEIPAKAVAVDPENDIAIFETAEDLPHYRPITFNESPAIGKWGFCIGAPGGRSPHHVIWGLFAARGIKAGNVYFGEIAVGDGPGSSGGGVYDADYNYCGVLVRGSEGVILYTPAKVVKPFVEKFLHETGR